MRTPSTSREARLSRRQEERPIERTVEYEPVARFTKNDVYFSGTAAIRPQLLRISMTTRQLFEILTQGLEADINRLNPWWRGLPQAPLPPVRRWAFPLALRRLKQGLAKITVLSGPRQVGKSTLVLQMIETLLDEGVPPTHICYIQFDELPEIRKLQEPILRLSDWFEQTILRKTFNQAAQEGQSVFLFLDEVQNLDSWAPQLKFLVDTSAIRVMVTGSSSLRIEQRRDSLAGRISTLEMGPLALS